MATAASNGWADPVTVPFVLRVDFATGDFRDLLGRSVQTGDALRGVLTYDAATPGSPLNNDLFGSYEDPAGSIRVEGTSFPGVAAAISNGAGENLFDVDFLTFRAQGDPPAAFGHFYTELIFTDFDQLVFGGHTIRNTALPTSASAVRRFTDRRFELHANLIGHPVNEEGVGSHAVFAHIEDLPAPVPEPATMALVGIGLAATWRARRNRAKRTRGGE